MSQFFSELGNDSRIIAEGATSRANGLFQFVRNINPRHAAIYAANTTIIMGLIVLVGGLIDQVSHSTQLSETRSNDLIVMVSGGLVAALGTVGRCVLDDCGVGDEDEAEADRQLDYHIV
ncbi:MAG TPA: hypothetical protein VHE99_10300 [Gammaproteobacteria bacterium]|nr:hypothetical protein [Gammaproteobacteria bacterium]